MRLFTHMDRVKRIWCLSPMRAATVQASLRIRAVSPEPSLLAHTSSESRGTFRQKARSLAPLNGWACAVEICHDSNARRHKFAWRGPYYSWAILSLPWSNNQWSGNDKLRHDFGDEKWSLQIKTPIAQRNQYFYSLKISYQIRHPLCPNTEYLPCDVLSKLWFP